MLAFLASSNAGIFNFVEDVWSFDLDEGDQSLWMSRIRDNVPLSQLVIPGTHGSMTDSVENSLFQTQNVPLAQQLLSGIRNADTGYSLDNVLTTIYDFLDQHPGETIILRIQKGGTFDFNTFLDSMEEYFVPGSELGDRAVQHIYAGNSDDTTLPTLGEARGKVVILQDFKSSLDGRYGIPGIRALLDRSKDYDKLRITHTTANGGINPIRVAAQAGGHPGMNAFLGRYLMLRKGDCFGIIVMDFPGRHLVKQIIKRNNHNICPGPINLTDQNAIDAAEGADLNHTRTDGGTDLNNENTAEEFDFTSISDFEPPSAEDSDDDSSDDEYSDDEDSDH
ncbi:1-phosphatidylinositol phosphodiesterase [Ceratocystis lukuohia]|uniref:1-phosphatidylinositol phosphodiesterase n=1 Tax=Ceratocystis lukuohia TaxID=2019550 RepID=A0ABR4M8Q7_9PEZI